MRPLLARNGAKKRMRDVEHAGEVDRDDVLPVLDHGLGRTGHAVAARDAGVVDQDGDRADRVGDLFGHRDAGRAVGDVERETVDGAAGVADQFCASPPRLRR